MSALRAISTILCAFPLAAALFLLGVAVSISTTVLNPAFIVSELDDVPVHTIFAEEAKKQVPPEAAFLLPLIDEVAVDLEPWAREQMAVVVRAASVYLKGQGEFSAVISLVEAKNLLETRLVEVMRESPPPGLEVLDPQQLDAFVALIVQELDNRFPDYMEITEAFLGAETMDGLRVAREFSGYVTWALRLLPVVALLAILLIALIQSWRGRPVARFIGAALILAGVAGVVAGYLVRSVAPGMLPTEIPPEVSAVLPGLIGDCCHPLLVYSGIAALVGIGLILLSFRLRTAEA